MGKLAQTRIERQTVPQQVVHTLRGKILTGELRPGERLVEADLAERLEISRNPLREALRQLIGEGLLVYRPHRGVAVWQPNRHDLWELFSLRAAIEGMAVRLALLEGRASELVAALQPLHAEMARAEAVGDRGLVDQIDVRFHERIVEAARNGRLRQAWDGTHPTVLMLALPPLVCAEISAVDAERHQHLIDAIARGSAQDAQEALISHILQGIQSYLPELPDGDDG